MAEPVRFPNIPLYEGWGAPNRVESDILGLELIAGELPQDLRGCLFRCGPDRQFPSLFKDDIFIDGEGMMHGWYFRDGQVDYKCRWVRNERFLLQEKARRSLFGRYRNRYTNDPSVAGKDQGTANTSAIWHGKTLLALKEDSLPMEVDPYTFEVKGYHNYNGKVNALSMTAHPKFDYAKNELLSFSYQAKGDATTDFLLHVVDASGDIVHQIAFHMPFPAMVHDFAVTDTHFVVPFFPIMTDMEVIKAGGPYYQWHQDKECHVAIVPRRGTADQIQWFKGPACSAGHMMNAFNEGSMLHLDLCLYEGNCFAFFPAYDGSEYKPCPPLLTRMTFDLHHPEAGFSKRVLGPMPSEMPQIDERFVGKPYRYGYTISFAPPRRVSQLGVWDHQTGELKLWNPGPDSSIQEPKFVPRGPGEGNGYLVMPVNRVAENRSDLAVLDAQNVEAGPIALFKMPIRVKASFHGMWVPAQTMQTGLYNFP